MNKAVASALGSTLSKDPTFVARFGGAEVDPPTAEDVSPADPGEPADKPAPNVPDPIEERFARLEKQLDEKQSYIKTLQDENRQYRDKLLSPEPEAEDDPVSKLEEYGVPADVAREAIDRQVRKGIEVYLAPYLQVEAAEKNLRATNAEYAEAAPKLEAYVRQNPELAKTVLALANAGQVEMAKKFAFDSYKLAMASEAKGADGEAARKAAKLDAGISPTQKGESRIPKDDAKEREARALEMAQRGGPRAVGKYLAGALWPKR